MFETTNQMMTLWIMMMSSDSNYTAGFWASGFCGQPHIATVCGSQQSKLHSGEQILSDQQKNDDLGSAWTFHGIYRDSQ